MGGPGNSLPGLRSNKRAHQAHLLPIAIHSIKTTALTDNPLAGILDGSFDRLVHHVRKLDIHKYAQVLIRFFVGAHLLRTNA